VHPRCSHDAHAATSAQCWERTCTCVPDGDQASGLRRLVAVVVRDTRVDSAEGVGATGEVGRGLYSEELGIVTFQCHQLVMGSCLYDASAVQQISTVRVSHT
jgi:hypothetical protein